MRANAVAIEEQANTRQHEPAAPPFIVRFVEGRFILHRFTIMLPPLATDFFYILTGLTSLTSRCTLDATKRSRSRLTRRGRAIATMGRRV